jgi:hypothetical protein
MWLGQLDENKKEEWKMDNHGLSKFLYFIKKQLVVTFCGIAEIPCTKNPITGKG